MHQDLVRLRMRSLTFHHLYVGITNNNQLQDEPLSEILGPSYSLCSGSMVRFTGRHFMCVQVVLPTLCMLHASASFYTSYFGSLYSLHIVLPYLRCFTFCRNDYSSHHPFGFTVSGPIMPVFSWVYH